MFESPFAYSAEHYKRQIDPVNQYLKQSASYLSIMTGRNIEECSSYVKNAINNNTIKNIVDPKVSYLERQDNGDREVKETTLIEYITTALKEQDLIAPTLTTYINPKIKESLLVNYVEDNIAARGVAKKAEFAAKAAGFKEKAKIFNIEQTNKKLRNNALSGAHVSASTPLYNKSAHSTLTSTCRSTSGYGNANNEKFLNGNRHYWCSDIVLNNIISIVTNTNYEKLNEVLVKYDIKIPSIEDTIKCITYSTNLYWTEQSHLNKIINLVNKLSDLQRAAFVYTGDFYHLMVNNQQLVKNMIVELSSKKTGTFPNALDIIKTIRSEYVDLAHQICFTEMKGKGKNYKDMENTKELETLVLTSINIGTTLDKYADLIKTLWATNNLPASVAYFPESIRRSAITSDTDSTIFTVQDWVLWYKGEMSFDNEAMAVAGVMIFLASQTITNVLATMSANFGFVGKRLFQVAMKNEFKFDVFVVTNVAKHYFSYISVQEGNVFKEREIEIKGVHLKSSNAPLKITKKATELMEFIMNSTLENKKISITSLLKDISQIEKEIIASVYKGDTDYFRLAQIKTADSYTKEETDSPYKHYVFWEDIFSFKYGKLTPPPYSCIKIPTILENASATRKWLDEIQDPVLAEKAKKWFKDNNRNVIPTIYLSLEISKSLGIPLEIQSIIDIRRMVMDLCNIFYILLETIGFHKRGNSLISDSY